MATADAAARVSSYDDLIALPDEARAELISGSLVRLPAPLPRHAKPRCSLRRFLGGPFDDDDGFGGPGGWWIFADVDVQLGEHVLRPDLSGWGRHRLEEPDVRLARIEPFTAVELPVGRLFLPKLRA